MTPRQARAAKVSSPLPLPPGHQWLVSAGGGRTMPGQAGEGARFHQGSLRPPPRRRQWLVIAGGQEVVPPLAGWNARPFTDLCDPGEHCGHDIERLHLGGQIDYLTALDQADGPLQTWWSLRTYHSLSRRATQPESPPSCSGSTCSVTSPPSTAGSILLQAQALGLNSIGSQTCQAGMAAMGGGTVTLSFIWQRQHARI